MSSAQKWPPKSGIASPSITHPLTEVGSGCRHLGDGIPRSEGDPLGNGQPQHPSPEGAGGCLRHRNGRRSLGSLHRPLHTHSRKLAQPGGDRNRHLREAMLGQAANPRSEESAPRGESLEPANESRSYQDQLEVRPQSSPPQIRLQKQTFHTVKDLVRPSARTSRALSKNCTKDLRGVSTASDSAVRSTRLLPHVGFPQPLSAIAPDKSLGLIGNARS